MADRTIYRRNSESSQEIFIAADEPREKGGQWMCKLCCTQEARKRMGPMFSGLSLSLSLSTSFRNLVGHDFHAV